MINKDIYQLKKYCKDYKNIENYTEALSSPLRYDLHHKREISENKSKKDLIADNLYYDRPASELIFLEEKEHIRLHNVGKHRSVDTRQKMSEAHKGHEGYWKGKYRPSFSTETRQKLSEARKGRHWHLENGKRIYTD